MGSDVIFLSLSRSLFLWFYVRYDLKEKDTHYTNVQLGLQLTGFQGFSSGILFHGSLFPAGPFSLGIGGWRVEGGSGPGTERT